MKVFTIGYEGVTQAEMIEALQVVGFASLADVRAVLLSRRSCFSKNIPATRLRGAGIDYIGLKVLGTPPEVLEAARRGDHVRLAAIYAGQLEPPEAMLQNVKLRDMAADRPTALLCFERDPHGCLRSLLIEAIRQEATVVDLFV